MNQGIEVNGARTANMSKKRSGANASESHTCTWKGSFPFRSKDFLQKSRYDQSPDQPDFPQAGEERKKESNTPKKRTPHFKAR